MTKSTARNLGFIRCRKLIILARAKTGNLGKREFKPKTGNLAKREFKAKTGILGKREFNKHLY